MKSFWDKMWSVVNGCERVDAGCKNCSAEFVFASVKNKSLSILRNNKWSGKVELVLDWDQPSRYRNPSHVFIAGMGDLFHKDVPDDFITNVLDIVEQDPRHLFYILTKRTTRLVEFLSNPIRQLRNLLVGVSISDQETADKHLPVLLKLYPHYRLWTNCEPMLAECDLSAYIQKLDFVGAGPETGLKKRAFEEIWLSDIFSLCREYDVKFFTNHGCLAKASSLPNLPERN